MFQENKTFYPTPKPLIKKMLKKIKGHPQSVLEPSAGRGDIIKELTKERWMPTRNGRTGSYHPLVFKQDVVAIESDEDLQATLRGKNIKVLDSNFLTFSGPDKFDLIIANPPFDHGDLHLLKAIDIMYSGQIIFLLNAETIRNPHTRPRQQLVQKMHELNAEIEYIQKAFEDAERPTGVEVALINIIIERRIEDELFKDVTDTVTDTKVELSDNYEVITGRIVEEMVAEYNQIVKLATDTILNYFKNFKKVGKYIGINQQAERNYSWSDNKETLTKQVQATLNATLVDIRKDFWRRVLELPEVTRRLTDEKRKEFDHQIEKRCEMDFTEHNIRSFVLNVIKGFGKNLREAIVNLFDKLTARHSWSGMPEEKNVHYYNGWKSNSAFKINSRVVFPVYGGYKTGPFRNWNDTAWELQYGTLGDLKDVDIVLNYFDGMKPGYMTISTALDWAFKQGTNQAYSTYFSKIIAYKKGTVHLTFRDEDILRRFNIEAAKGKDWLPEDYGRSRYNQLDEDHKRVVEAFEGIDSYEQNFGRIGFDMPKFPQIELIKEAA